MFDPKYTFIDEPINKPDRYAYGIIERLDKLILLFGALALQNNPVVEEATVTVEEIKEEVTPKKRTTKKK